MDETELMAGRLLTVPEVAKLTRSSTWAVRRWIGEGELDAVRLGGGQKARYLVSGGALRAFIRDAAPRGERR